MRVEQPVGVSFAVRRLVSELPSVLFASPRFVVPLYDKTFEMALGIRPLAGLGSGVPTTPLEICDHGPDFGRIPVEVPADALPRRSLQVCRSAMTRAAWSARDRTW